MRLYVETTAAPISLSAEITQAWATTTTNTKRTNFPKQFDGELGITIMRLHGPYYCSRCDGIVTEQTCPHEATDPHAVNHIAGTDMRAMLSGGQELTPASCGGRLSML